MQEVVISAEPLVYSDFFCIANRRDRVGGGTLAVPGLILLTVFAPHNASLDITFELDAFNR